MIRTKQRSRLWLTVLLSLLSGCASGLTNAETTQKARFHYKLANNYFYDNKVVPALHELENCLKFDPDFPDAHFLEGFIFFGRKEYARAEEHFRRALTLRPAFHAARANLGALLLASKRWAEAIDVLEPLVDATLYGTPWIVQNNLGYAWQRLGKLSKAERHYKMAIFHNRKFCLGFNNLGALYQERGQTEDAMDLLSQAIRFCKKYPEPHFHMAELLISMGRDAEARQQYQACWKDAPDSPYGRRCRRRL